MLSIDATKAWRTRRSGDITIIYTWVNGERALILLPALRPGAPWFVVTDSAAYQWDDSNPRTVPAVVAKATKACEVLGIEPSATNMQRVARIVIEGLEDLIRMPHEPTADAKPAVIGKMSFLAGGRQMQERPLLYTPQGTGYGG